ncbi:MAG: phosphotransferase [Isosphaeraceae bacterium]
MLEDTTHATISIDPEEHPALTAWREFRGERVGTERIEVVTLKCREKSAVYRLVGAGPGESAVIVKRCLRTTGLIEHTIYKNVLPHLPVSALRSYGLVEGEGGRSCWLFLEDACGEVYSPENAAHRALAAQWLGLMHTSATRITPPPDLPDRGPGHYLGLLRSTREIILSSLTNPALTDDDVAVLESIVRQYNNLEARWDRVQKCCYGVPRTLVHNDFAGHNMRIRTREAGATLLPFDWEFAGWGIPAVDLVLSLLPSRRFSWNPDLVAYWAVVREDWPEFDLQAIRRWANLATWFRCLNAISWDAPELAQNWAGEFIDTIRYYQAVMDCALQEEE